MLAPIHHGLTSQELDAVEKAAQWIAVQNITVNQLRQFLGNAIPDRDLAAKFQALSPVQVQSILNYLQDRRKSDL